MTNLQILSLLIMPIAGLWIGIVGLYLFRREDRRYKLHAGG